MPTYRNGATKNKYINGKYLKPNETIQSYVYNPDPDLILESHEPYPKKMVMLCEDYIINAESEILIELPYPGQNDGYILTVMNTGNVLLLYIDMDTTAVPLLIDNMTNFKEQLNWREHAYIKIVNENLTTEKVRVSATAF